MHSEDIENLEPSWKPIGTVERRVLGVLVEKAKTTPDAYPLTLNAITTGSNQKSNRSPLMQLDPIDVENALDNLRQMGAVAEVIGSGRAAKYRHRLYEWMGIDKTEAAVMTELLLRGEQTIGELRGRAARMGKIAGVAELKPMLQSLMDKGLVQALTPSGRGQLVTHCLYLPEQQDKLKRTHGIDSQEPQTLALDEGAAECENSPSQKTEIPSPTNSATSIPEPLVAELREQVELLTDTVARLEKRLENLEQLIN